MGGIMQASLGELQFDDADNANIPVDIWLVPVTEDDSIPGGLNFEPKFVLRAANYCPRKCNVYDSAYEVYADNREELVNLLNKHVIPLYKTALNILNEMADGTNDGLYYWG